MLLANSSSMIGKKRGGGLFQVLLVLFLTCRSDTLADILVFSIADRHQIEGEFKDMPAKFGKPIPPEGIKGMLAYADPPTACQEIKMPPNVTNYAGDWIVLIARYNCSFEIKIRMAQQAGYNAAIVHNVGSNELEPMSAKNSLGLWIPSVFVSDISGLILGENYLFDKSYFVLINDDFPFNIKIHLLLPFAIVVGICFFIMVIFMIVRCIKDRRRQRRHRLPHSSLKKIPTHKYTKGDPYETCAICLDDYAEGEKLRVLPCAHAYHAKCIDPWLTKNRRVCPCCKRKVFAADERVVTDSESDSDVDDSTPLIRELRSGTQGGTFTSQQDSNPFVTVRIPRPRHGSNNSESSSSNSSSSSSLESNPAEVSYDDADSYNNIESTAPFFTVSDNHSINGEMPESERSVSSTKPHTISLYADAQERWVPVVHHAPERSERSRTSRVATNPSASNPNTASGADNTCA